VWQNGRRKKQKGNDGNGNKRRRLDMMIAMKVNEINKSDDDNTLLEMT
jgi:hypothetical protein